ncbi:hypothetical protein [Actinoplanes sp. GCM10030250]|uniref:hypothetical protein n=1 Tax=Actinoplanes sp. GCM10030250 TaxID=3273376 RepID=UPI00360F0C1A
MSRALGRMAAIGTLALIVAFTTSSMWMSYLEIELPSGYSRADGIYLLAPNAEKVDKARIEFQSWMISGVERNERTAATDAQVQMLFSMNDRSRSDFYVVSTGSAAELLEDCTFDSWNVAINDISGSNARTAVADIWHHSFAGTISKVIHVSVRGAPGFIQELTCHGEGDRSWVAERSQHYMRAPLMRVIPYAPKGDHQGIFHAQNNGGEMPRPQHDFCATVQFLLTRGSVLDYSYPATFRETPGGLLYRGDESMSPPGGFVSTLSWTTCGVQLIDLNGKKAFGVVDGSLVDVGVSDLREKSTDERNLLLGGAALGLIAALLVEVLVPSLQLGRHAALKFASVFKLFRRRLPFHSRSARRRFRQSPTVEGARTAPPSGPPPPPAMRTEEEAFTLACIAAHNHCADISAATLNLDGLRLDSLHTSDGRWVFTLRESAGRRFMVSIPPARDGESDISVLMYQTWRRS